MIENPLREGISILPVQYSKGSDFQERFPPASCSLKPPECQPKDAAELLASAPTSALCVRLPVRQKGWVRCFRYYIQDRFYSSIISIALNNCPILLTGLVSDSRATGQNYNVIHCSARRCQCLTCRYWDSWNSS